jgi:hypothetical protein
MAPPLSYQLLDRLLGGTLAARIGTARSEGASYGRIAHELSVELDVYVSGETIRRWHTELNAAVAS